MDSDSAAIRLPAERAKTKEGRIIPLSPVALSVLDELPRFAGGDFVFGQGGQAPFANVGHAKARLDRTIGEDRGEPMPAWRLHDIRRTVATGLQRLGTRLEVIEAVLGHVSGSRAGIVGIYQRHRFENEGRMALTALGRTRPAAGLARPTHDGGSLRRAALNVAVDRRETLLGCRLSHEKRQFVTPKGGRLVEMISAIVMRRTNRNQKLPSYRWLPFNE